MHDETEETPHHQKNLSLVQPDEAVGADMTGKLKHTLETIIATCYSERKG